MMNFAPSRFFILCTVLAFSSLCNLSFAKEETTITIGSADLVVSISQGESTRDWGISIHHAAADRTWTANVRRRNGRLLNVKKMDGDAALLSLETARRRLPYACKVSVTEHGSVEFELYAEDSEAELTEELHFPPEFRTDLRNGHLLFCDRSSGVFLPQSDETYADQPMMVYGNTQALDLPFIGVLEQNADFAVSGSDGDGMMLHFKTPYNCGIRLEQDDEGNLWPGVIWFPSLGKFEGTRKVELVMQDAGGPVRMAKTYREIARSNGKVVPLSERAIERPELNWLLGAPVIWGSDGLQFAREAQTRGFRRAIVNGRFPPADMTQLREMEFLTSEYDSYTDISEGPPGYQTDNIEEASYYLSDGSLRKGWRTMWGKQYYFRSHALAKSRAKLYVPEIIDTYNYTARFVDVSAAINLFEDYKPGRTFGTEQDMLYRRELFRYFTEELGIVLGAEHSKDWSMPLIDYTEGTMSGPFWWLNHKAGHLERYSSYDEFPEDFLRIGINPAVRFPLWDLVFHDTVVNTWYWGDSSGYQYDIAPEMSETKDLLNILHGTPPLMWANHLGYGWDRERERFVDTWRSTCLWHEIVGFDELLSHEYLSPDRLVQRTRFSSGATAVVNFGDAPFDTELNGTTYKIAPRGFLAEAPKANFIMSKVLRDGNVETRIESEAHTYLESDQLISTPAANGTGRIDVISQAEDKYTLALQGSWTVNLSELSRHPQSNDARVFQLAGDGSAVALEKITKSNESIFLEGNDDTASLFTVRWDSSSEYVSILPETKVPSTTTIITLANNTKGSEIFYTIDGTMPDVSSVPYTGPFELGKSTFIRAQTFLAGEPKGPVATREYHPEVTMVDNVIHRGGEPSIEIDLDVSHADLLLFEYGDAGDGYNFDSVALAEAYLINHDNRKIPLTSLNPLYIEESSGGPYEFGESVLVEVGGKTYQGGYLGHADSKLAWELDGKYKRFVALSGNRDRPEGKGSISMSVRVRY